MQTKMLINGEMVEGGLIYDPRIEGIPGTGCDMSVYALDAYMSVRHVMVVH